MIKKIAGMALGGLVMVIVFGYLTAMALTELVPAAMTGNWAGLWNPGLFLKGSTWLYGLIVSVMVFMLGYPVFGCEWFRSSDILKLSFEHDSVRDILLSNLV